MDITQSKNIFIYGVCGRSSSTALQRILNSSDEIFLFGEHHLAIEKLVDCYFHLSEIDHETNAQELVKLLECFQSKRHTSFYANATNDMQFLKEEIRNIIIQLLQPPRGYTKTGYKEIGTTSPTSLLRLQKFFPNSYFIFIFRDPLKQWGSVGFLKSFWDYSKTLNAFLKEYVRIANIYLKTSLKNAFFVENTALRDEKKVRQILKVVELKNFDSSLSYKTISSTNRQKIILPTKVRVLSSKAFRMYQEMQKRELSYLDNSP